MSQIQNSLKQAGIALPTPAAPVANYVGSVITGNLLVISGQLCLGADGKLDAAHRGKLGDGVSLEAGQAAARLCAINLLAQAGIALGGNLDRIRRCVRLGGFINANPAYAQIPQVMNGASDLIVQILGDSGRHARSTVGVAQLPLDCAVEVEAMFEIAQD
ncbi:MAG: RidA family protein [Afipia sp.]